MAKRHPKKCKLRPRRELLSDRIKRWGDALRTWDWLIKALLRALLQLLLAHCVAVA